jgi:virulence factor Mce-like protein
VITRARIVAAITAVALLFAGGAGWMALSSGSSGKELSAIFSRTNNLFEEGEVRMLGLEVGTITDITAKGSDVEVSMRLQPGIQVPAQATATIVPKSALGERFVSLRPDYTGGPTLPEGATIPTSRTKVPAELDEVLRSLEDLASSLEPDRIANLVDALAGSLEGNGGDLNTLIGEATDAITTLADNSNELVATVEELGNVTEALSTRSQQLGPLVQDLSTVMRTIGDESDALLEAVSNLRRLTTAIRPIAEEHAEPLVDDLGELATTVSTVERNLARIDKTLKGSALLFEAGGRANAYQDAYLGLDNESGQMQGLSDVIRDRIMNRLIGVCLRLGVGECDSASFWEPFMPQLLCVRGLGDCPQGAGNVGETLREAIAELPKKVQKQLPVGEATGDSSGDGSSQGGRQVEPVPSSSSPPLAPQNQDQDSSTGGDTGGGSPTPLELPSSSASPSPSESSMELLPDALGGSS